jgi:hypothetical protein
VLPTVTIGDWLNRPLVNVTDAVPDVDDEIVIVVEPAWTAYGKAVFDEIVPSEATATIPGVPNPTLVNEELTTVEFKVTPVRVPAAAVTVPEAPNEIAVPFTVTEELVNPALGMVETEPITPPEVVVT